MNQPPNAVLFPGRFQPLHAGHIEAIRTLLTTHTVMVGVFDTPLSSRNPYSLRQRFDMIRDEFKDDMAECKLGIYRLPWVQGIVSGRDCGWDHMEVKLAPEVEAISATEIRKAM